MSCTVFCEDVVDGDEDACEFLHFKSVIPEEAKICLVLHWPSKWLNSSKSYKYVVLLNWNALKVRPYRKITYFLFLKTKMAFAVEPYLQKVRSSLCLWDGNVCTRNVVMDCLEYFSGPAIEVL